MQLAREGGKSEGKLSIDFWQDAGLYPRLLTFISNELGQYKLEPTESCSVKAFVSIQLRSGLRIDLMSNIRCCIPSALGVKRNLKPSKPSKRPYQYNDRKGMRCKSKLTNQELEEKERSE